MVRKIAVCDDSSLILRQLAGYLEQLQKELPDALCPSYFSSAEELLDGMASDTALLLMDISMGGMNGIECARLLRRQGNSVPIIFITSMTEYALDGYAVHAFGFLPKPVTYSDFSAIIKELFARQQAEKPKKLLVNTASGVRILDPDDVVYAEVYQHETSFILQRGEPIKGNVQMNAVEPMLIPHGFFRCHKSYLVSFRHISFIGRDALTMTGGQTIPLSKHKRKAFLDEYGSYMGVQLG